MPRTPFTVRLFVVLSWVLGWWLVIEGLALRWWGEPFRFGAPLLWVATMRAYGVEMGWPYLVAGFCLVGASFGLVLKRRWGYLTGLAACGLALFYYPAGLLLGGLGLLTLIHPATRNHFHAPNP